MCPICEHRPKAKGSRYCSNCLAKMGKTVKTRSAQKPVKFATYRGHVIGFFPNGKQNGRVVLRAELLRRKPEGLPKGKTLDLNHYIEGFDRGQVQKIKKTILQLASR